MSWNCPVFGIYVTNVGYLQIGVTLEVAHAPCGSEVTSGNWVVFSLNGWSIHPHDLRTLSAQLALQFTWNATIGIQLLNIERWPVLYLLTQGRRCIPQHLFTYANAKQNITWFYIYGRKINRTRKVIFPTFYSWGPNGSWLYRMTMPNAKVTSVEADWRFPSCSVWLLLDQKNSNTSQPNISSKNTWLIDGWRLRITG